MLAFYLLETRNKAYTTTLSLIFKSLDINSILITFSSLVLTIFNPIDGIKDSKSNSDNWAGIGTCRIEKVNLETKDVEKNRKFLFWKLSHKKVVIIDRVTDDNGNVILDRKSKLIQTMDSSEDIKFRRIKLVYGEIWVFRYNRNPKNEFIKRYNNCGKYLGKRKWESGDFYDDAKN